MKKTLFLTLLLSIAFGLLLYSCRTEDEAVVSENRNNTESASFQVFKDHSSQYARRGGSMFYQEGFRDLYLSYYKDHPEEAPDADSSDFHIDFRRASQVLYGADSTRYVLFPFMKGNEVKYVVACSVNNNHDYVSFYFPERNKMVDNAITAFSLASRSNAMSRGERCGFEGEPPCEIEEITINGPTNEVTPTLSPGTPYGFDPDYQFPPSGGCGPYNNCGGGGGTPYQPTPPPPLSPCDKTKAITTNPKMQAGLKELKDQSALPKSDPNYGEKGIKFKADGTPSATITGEDHKVNFGDKTGYEGGYHNHTVAGTPMFSPPDIDQLLGFARAQPTSNPSNVNNAYLGMIAPNGTHYVITFGGNYQDALITFTDDNLKALKDDYKEWAGDLKATTLYGTTYINSDGSINNLGVETLFFKILKKMGLDGKVNLQRIETNGTINSITLNSSNQPTSVTCP